MSSDKDLLNRFVSCFEDDEDTLALEQPTSPAALSMVYKRLPAKFPKLFELLLLNYRWREVYLYNSFRLLDNPPGSEDLAEFVSGIFKDEYLGPVCMNYGYVQFGFHYDRYDPLCFNTNSGSSPDQYEIVILDHELILQFSKIKIISTLASSFEELISVPYPRQPPWTMS